MTITPESVMEEDILAKTEKDVKDLGHLRIGGEEEAYNELDNISISEDKRADRRVFELIEDAGYPDFYIILLEETKTGFIAFSSIEKTKDIILKVFSDCQCDVIKRKKNYKITVNFPK